MTFTGNVMVRTRGWPARRPTLMKSTPSFICALTLSRQMIKPIRCRRSGPDAPALSKDLRLMSNQDNEKKPGGGMSVREAGQKGGETVKKKYGPEFYEAIGRKGGQATKAAHGHAFYEQIGKKGGKKGGEATRDRYGPSFYEEIGQKGGQKVKALIEQGKRAAADAADAAAAAEKKAS